MKASLRHLVRERAGKRCEYCGLPDDAAPAASFHVEHIYAKQHEGDDDLENLCWSCHRCNLSKGPNLSGRDPIGGRIVLLFHSRIQLWTRHFLRDGPFLVGRTQSGRATIAVLDINHPQRVELRQALMVAEEWPEE
jgi:hypothetical protein